jgi:hypothetical protein
VLGRAQPQPLLERFVELADGEGSHGRNLRETEVL